MPSTSVTRVNGLSKGLNNINMMLKDVNKLSSIYFRKSARLGPLPRAIPVLIYLLISFCLRLVGYAYIFLLSTCKWFCSKWLCKFNVFYLVVCSITEYTTIFGLRYKIIVCSSIMVVSNGVTISLYHSTIYSKPNKQFCIPNWLLHFTILVSGWVPIIQQ